MAHPKPGTVLTPIPHSPAHSIRFPLTIQPQNSTPLPSGHHLVPSWAPRPAQHGSHRDKSGHTPPLLQAPSVAPKSLKSSMACKALQSCPQRSPRPRLHLPPLQSQGSLPLSPTHQAQAHLDPYPSPSLCLKTLLPDTHTAPSLTSPVPRSLPALSSLLPGALSLLQPKGHLSRLRASLLARWFRSPGLQCR